MSRLFYQSLAINNINIFDRSNKNCQSSLIILQILNKPQKWPVLNFSQSEIFSKSGNTKSKSVFKKIADQLLLYIYLNLYSLLNFSEF